MNMNRLNAGIATLLLAVSALAYGAGNESANAVRADGKPDAKGGTTAAAARYKRIRAKAHRNAARAKAHARAMRAAEEGK